VPPPSPRFAPASCVATSGLGLTLWCSAARGVSGRTATHQRQRCICVCVHPPWQFGVIKSQNGKSLYCHVFATHHRLLVEADLVDLQLPLNPATLRKEDVSAPCA
jgi:hypothetical protein